jgi:hypothetical protein
MTALHQHLIWAAGFVHVGIIAPTFSFRAGCEFARSSLGRFLSAFIAAFWSLRIILQLFCYDREVRRANRFLDSLYLAALALTVVIFGASALSPMR